MGELRNIEDGAVYTAKDFLRWDANPNRLLLQLEAEGMAKRLGHGLWQYRPQENRFGSVPPSSDKLLDAFLGKGQYLLTGSQYWNALGLGSTQMWKMDLVYNQHVEGQKSFGAKEFLFKRKSFPLNPDPEWYVVDLFNNREKMSVTFEELSSGLMNAVDAGKFSVTKLADNFLQWGSKEDAKAVLKALRPNLYR